jgi:hypothetical protein
LKMYLTILAIRTDISDHDNRSRYSFESQEKPPGVV